MQSSKSNNGRSFAEQIKRAYKRVRPFLAYLLVITAFGFRFTSIPDASIGALTGLALIIVHLLFDLHRQSMETQSTYDEGCFGNFGVARPKITEVFSEYVAKRKKCKIRCLGITLRYQWEFLEEFLTRVLNEPRPPRLIVEIAMLDPTWGEINEFGDSWHEHTKANDKRLTQFIQNRKERFEELGWKVEVYHYRFIPHWFGLLLDKNTLFLGRSFWKDHGKLWAGQNHINLYRSTDCVDGNAIIKEFIGWFDYCIRQNVCSSDRLNNQPLAADLVPRPQTDTFDD